MSLSCQYLKCLPNCVNICGGNLLFLSFEIFIIFFSLLLAFDCFYRCIYAIAFHLWVFRKQLLAWLLANEFLNWTRKQELNKYDGLDNGIDWMGDGGSVAKTIQLYTDTLNTPITRPARICDCFCRKHHEREREIIKQLLLMAKLTIVFCVSS